jgi:hypothetical protein
VAAVPRRRLFAFARRNHFVETDVSPKTTVVTTVVRGNPKVDRRDAYRHFAAQCVELARVIESSQDRTILLEMALLWSRLAERAAASFSTTPIEQK